ncbi:MAG: hypothetical protein ACXV6K_07450, partial [Halobacteriota archaeon]
LIRLLPFIAFKVFFTLRVASEVLYRYAMRILTAACITAIATTPVTQRVIYSGPVTLEAAFGHLVCPLCFNSSKS